MKDQLKNYRSGLKISSFWINYIILKKYDNFDMHKHDEKAISYSYTMLHYQLIFLIFLNILWEILSFVH